METFLPPIEHPQGLILRLAYFFTRQQFGKVLTGRTQPATAPNALSGVITQRKEAT
jgi:hypothetical protein